MLRIKTFPISEDQAANTFMETHLPLTTDKMQGVQLNMGNIVIFYDDGVFNKAHIAQKFHNLSAKEEEEIVYSKDKLARLRAVLKKTVPAGYKENLTDEQVLALCTAEGDSKIQAKNRVEGISLQENDVKMQVAHIMECQDNIKMFEESAKQYEHTN